MAEDNTKALIRCFEDAFVQRHLLEPRMEDLRLIANGWQLRYAVDANVLALYTEPGRHAAAGKFLSIGAGEIFRDDDPVRKVKVAAALAEFIWNSLQPIGPMLVLPPINQEAERMTQHHIREFRRQTETEPPALAEIRTRLLAAGHVLNRKDLADLRDAIMLDGSPQAAMARVSTLLSNGRIRSADGPTILKGYDEPFRRALRPATEIVDMFEFVEKRDAWLDRLQKLGRVVSDRAARDAEAMARLEVCNSRLMAGGETKRRLIYITSDGALLRVAEEYEFKLEGKPQGSFSRLFVRHPRAYLDEPQVLSPAQEHQNAVALSQWLDVILGRFDDLDKRPRFSIGSLTSNVVLTKTIVAAIEELSEKDGSAANKILSEWSRYETESNLDPPPNYVNRLLSTTQSSPKEFLDQLDLLRDKIRTSRQEAWEAYFSIGMTTRFILEVVTESSPLTREPPPLLFEARPRLHAFLDVAQTWLERAGAFSLESYKEQRLAVYKEDESGYGEYIAHGYLMALQMQWKTAAIFAARAIECVVEKNPLPTRSNGREAYYFEAFCRRHSAGTVDDLDHLDDLLSQADRVAKTEIDNLGEKEFPHDPVVERFEGERHALRLSRLLFRWSSASPSDKPAQLDEIGGMVFTLERFGAKVARRYEQLLVDQSEERDVSLIPEYYIPIETRRGILRRMWIRTLRNILAISLQVPEVREAGRAPWETLQRISSESGDDLARLGILNGSYFASFLLLCGALHFSQDKRFRRHARRKLGQLFDDRQRARRKVFPYDIARMADIYQKLPSP